MTSDIKINREIERAVRCAGHIAVLKLRAIGDSIWLLPVVDNLKQNLPDTKITVVVNKGTEAFFRHKGSVDNVLAFPRDEAKKKPFGFLKFLSFIKELRALGPGVIIDLNEGDRPAIISYLSGAPVRISYANQPRHLRSILYTHRFEAKLFEKHFIDYHLDVLREAGLEVFDPSIRIELPEAAFESLGAKMPAAFVEAGKKVLVQPGASWPLKQWGAANFARLADMLGGEGCKVFVVTGPGEEALLEETLGQMNTVPEASSSELDLYEFAALCKRCDVFVGNDSGPMHIASALTFTVGIFGPTPPEFFGPWCQRKLVFRNAPPLTCEPCPQVRCDSVEFHACMRGTRPQDVAGKVMEILGGALEH